MRGDANWQAELLTLNAVYEFLIRFASHPIDPPSPDDNLPARNRSDTFRVELMFGRLDTSMEAFGSITIQNPYAPLRDDRSGIHPGIHEVNRATRHLHSIIQRLLPSFEPGKGRQ